MKLWLLTQTAVDGYDTFDSCVVIAPNADAARSIGPSGRPIDPTNKYPSWALRAEDVTATYLGEFQGDVSVLATLGDSLPVVCASFNAG